MEFIFTGEVCISRFLGGEVEGLVMLGFLFFCFFYMFIVYLGVFVVFCKSGCCYFFYEEFVGFVY